MNDLHDYNDFEDLDDYDNGFDTRLSESLPVENLPGEVWKSIEGYEGLYQISSAGRVKSLEREVKCGDGFRIVKEMVLTQLPNIKDKYMYVTLWRKGKKKKCYVKNLVEDAFNLKST